MKLVGEKAINFKASAVMSDGKIDDSFDLADYSKGSNLVLFFYPLDFTFVCPTEVVAFSNRIEDFRALNAKVVGVSVDSKYAHHRWRETDYSNGGIGKVQYPLVSDITHSISSQYDVLHQSAVALRATFLMDKTFVIRHMSVNDLPMGRNIDEYLRLLEAWQHYEEYGEVCPAGWNSSKPAMGATEEGVADYMTSNAIDL